MMTPERVDRIVQAIRGGAPRHSAAAFAGIHRATLQDWLARGHAGEQPYADFLDRVEEAEGTRIVKSATTISTSADWRAHAWLLERWTPEFRRPPEQVELTNPDGSLQPVGVALQMTPDAVRLLRELRNAELAAGPARQSSIVRALIE